MTKRELRTHLKHKIASLPDAEKRSLIDDIVNSVVYFMTHEGKVDLTSDCFNEILDHLEHRAINPLAIIEDM